MTCNLCASLAGIDYSKFEDGQLAVPFSVEDVYPGFPELNKNVNGGCDFCRLLTELLGEYLELTERALERPAHFQLGKAVFFTKSHLVQMTEEQENEQGGLYSLKMQLVYGSASHTQELHFSVYSNSSSASLRPGCRPLRRPLDENPLSVDAVSLLRGWISQCVRDHPTCSVQDRQFQPTRLLNVRARTFLQHMGNTPQVPYVALSHCWGVPNPEKPMLRTLSSSLEDHSRDIPIESMPANFRDAVRVVQSLGYEYLWIDSLCIIQDSAKDWEREAALMADIYKFAAVTIVPVAARSCHDGFLHMRDFRRARIPNVCFGDGAATGSLTLQITDPRLTHWEIDIEDSTWNSRGWCLQERLLSRRTIFFSRYRMYFECKRKEEIRTEDDEPPFISTLGSAFNWEDTGSSSTGEASGESSIASGSGSQRTSPKPYLTSHHSSSDNLDATSQTGVSMDSEDRQTENIAVYAESRSSVDQSSDFHTPYYAQIFQVWYNIVTNYTGRNLSYGEDKFPATEGLARDISTQCNVGRYLAGIWERDLAQGLLWKPEHNWEGYIYQSPLAWPPDDRSGGSQAASMTLRVVFPAEYRAPSWSWACLDGRVRWPYATHREMFRPDLDFVDAQLHFEGESIYGRMKDACLTVKGKHQKVSVSGPKNVDQVHLPKFPSADRVEPEHFHSDYEGFVYSINNETGSIGYAAFDAAVKPLSEDLVALSVICQPADCIWKGIYSGLILRKDSGREDMFQRVGIFVLHEDHLDAFDHVPPRFLKMI